MDRREIDELQVAMTEAKRHGAWISAAQARLVLSLVYLARRVLMLQRLSNLDKHGLDMADFADHFDFDGAVRFPAKASKRGRVRFGLIGWFNGVVVVAAILFSLGTEALSLVSLRVANQQERDRYGI